MTGAASRPPERFAVLADAVREHREKLASTVAEAEGTLARFASREPSTLELYGAGKVADDFYTGAEKVFERIAPELNGGLPAGASWHRDLLHEMTRELRGIRPALLRRETEAALESFLRFRHRYRNLYGFDLEWPKLGRLLGQVPEAWNLLRADLDAFVQFLDAAARG